MYLPLDVTDPQGNPPRYTLPEPKSDDSKAPKGVDSPTTTLTISKKLQLHRLRHPPLQTCLRKDRSDQVISRARFVARTRQHEARPVSLLQFTSNYRYETSPHHSGGEVDRRTEVT